MTTHPTEPAVDLLPCPFCGKMARAVRSKAFRDAWLVECKSGHSNGVIYAEKSNAIDEWNRRAVACGLKSIPGASILGAHDGTLPDAVYDAIAEPADAGETIRQLRDRIDELEYAAAKVMAAAELREAYHRLPNDKNRIGEPKSRKGKARDAWLKAFRRAVSATALATKGPTP